MPYAKLIGVEKHCVAVGQVQLFLLPLQSVCPLLYACDEAFADGSSEQLVLFFGDADFVVVGIFDLVFRVFMLVLIGIGG
jgi:hypothetical protein